MKPIKMWPSWVRCGDCDKVFGGKTLRDIWDKLEKHPCWNKVT